MARKKTVVKARPKTGLAAVPLDDFWKMKWHFHQELDKREYVQVTKDFIKTYFNKDEVKAILANPEYNLYMYSHVAASCFWEKLGKEFPENWPAKERIFDGFLRDLIPTGNAILKEKKVEADVAPVVRKSPAELLKAKVSKTILTELDELEDKWMDGDKAELDIFARMNALELKAAAVSYVREYVQPRLQELLDAYNKTCDQAVEGFSHLTRRELSRRIKVWEGMLLDLDKLKTASKATRKPRVKKPTDASKQIKRLKYKKSDGNLKIASVDPLSIIGSTRLLAVNCKYNTITEYVSNKTTGFEIKGTTLLNFDPELSRTKTMRKPEEFLANVSKTIKQFDKLFNALSTKERTPNGRINEETILVRVD